MGFFSKLKSGLGKVGGYIMDAPGRWWRNVSSGFQYGDHYTSPMTPSGVPSVWGKIAVGMVAVAIGTTAAILTTPGSPTVGEIAYNVTCGAAVLVDHSFGKSTGICEICSHYSCRQYWPECADYNAICLNISQNIPRFGDVPPLANKVSVPNPVFKPAPTITPTPTATPTVTPTVTEIPQCPEEFSSGTKVTGSWYENSGSTLVIAVSSLGGFQNDHYSAIVSDPAGSNPTDLDCSISQNNSDQLECRGPKISSGGKGMYGYIDIYPWDGECEMADCSDCLLYSDRFMIPSKQQTKPSAESPPSDECPEGQSMCYGSCCSIGHCCNGGCYEDCSPVDECGTSCSIYESQECCYEKWGGQWDTSLEQCNCP